MEQIEWDDGCRILLRAAREISRELGHQEVTCPLHLLLGLLINARPRALEVPEPKWSVVQATMKEFAPPWDEGLVLTPGCQTPATKRVLERAIVLAAEAGEPVDVGHVWAALQEWEPRLVAEVLSRLAAATGD